MTGLDEFQERRFLGTLQALVQLLDQHHVEKWANWFRGDLVDYLAAQGPPRQVARQQAVTQHVLMAFGGMSNFRELRLSNESGDLLEGENKRLQFLCEQLWAATRGVQGYLAGIESQSK